MLARALPLLTILACAKTSAPSVDAQPRTAPPSQESASQVRLGVDGEPGRPLHLTGVLARAEDRSPLPGLRFLVYQADVDGEYDARVPDDDSTGRLAAPIVTDSAGRFSIRTILPGIYGTPPGDPHIHVDVPDATPPRHDIYFADHMGESTRRWATGNRQVHIVTLAVEPDGTLVGHVELAVPGVEVK